MSNEIGGVPPAGWYSDPQDATLFRWWNGVAWTEHSSPMQGVPVAYSQHTAKETTVAYLLCIFLGGFAAHHFYLGKIGSAISLVCLWWGGWALAPFGVGFFLLFLAAGRIIVDLFAIPRHVRTANIKLLRNQILA